MSDWTSKVTVVVLVALLATGTTPAETSLPPPGLLSQAGSARLVLGPRSDRPAGAVPTDGWERRRAYVAQVASSRAAQAAAGAPTAHPKMQTQGPAVQPGCPDQTGDGIVNLADYVILAHDWLQQGYELAGDFDFNQYVDLADLGCLVTSWLRRPPCANLAPVVLPYLTSFESYQGYYADPYWPSPLGGQQNWEWLAGEATVEPAEIWVDDLQRYLPMQVALLEVNSDVRKAFDDVGADHQFVRLHLVPGWGADVRVTAEDEVIAAVRFGPDFYLQVLDGADFVDTSLDYSWSWYYMEPVELRVELNWGAGQYAVYWQNEPNAVATAAFGVPAQTLTHLEFRTTDDWFIINRLSIGDFADPGLSRSIDKPCYCQPENGGISRARVPVLGHLWWDRLGVYEIRFCPVDLNPEEPNNWLVADSDVQVVDYGRRLGYWNTGAIPNGFYYLGLYSYDDTALLRDAVMLEQPVAVSGELKCNTLRLREEPDITVAWPGRFPFELRRTYDNNRRLYGPPLAPGWTHSFQISLREDSCYYYEAQDQFPYGQMPYYDQNQLGFGYIYVTGPDGARRLFRHTTGNAYSPTSGYEPYPEDDSGDTVTRISSGDGFSITGAYYFLRQRDGTTYSFREVPLDIWAPQGSGFGQIGWSWQTSCQSIADRFGNSLSVEWDSLDRAVTEVRWGDYDTGVRLRFYDENHDGYTEEARLLAGRDEEHPLRTVRYRWDDDNQVFSVTAFNHGADPNGVYCWDPNRLLSITRYQYDPGRNLVRIARGGDLAQPTTEISYDGWGRVAARRDHVDDGLALDTTYAYRFHHPYPNDDGISHLETVEQTAYRLVTTEQDNNGALLSRRVAAADQSPARDVACTYDDGAHPLKPTAVLESFDGQTRRTHNRYDAYGDLVEQTVFDEAGKPLATEMDYHHVYGLPTRRTAWQWSSRTGRQVETRYAYGQADGTVGPDPAGNKYLVREETLLGGDPNLCAVTTLRYDSRGLVTERLDPNGFRTTWQYDPRGYPAWVSVGPPGQEEPVERSCYDAIGQLRLRANAQGGVELFDWDGFGRLYRHLAYEDVQALAPAVSFTPERYTVQHAGTLLAQSVYGYDGRGNRTFEQKPDYERSPGGVCYSEYNRANLLCRTCGILWDSPGQCYTETSRLILQYDDRGLKVRQTSNDQCTGRRADVAFAHDALGRLIDTCWFDYDDGPPLKRVVCAYGGNDQKLNEDVYNGEILESSVAFAYDLFDRLRQRVEDPAGLVLTTRCGCDAVGNRIWQIDPRGGIRYFDYDNANRLVAESFTVEYLPDDPNASRSLATQARCTRYYPNGAVAELTNYDYALPGTPPAVLSRVAFTYDARDRVIQVVEDLDASHQAITRFDYQDNGFLFDGRAFDVRCTDAAGNTTYFASDALGQPVGVRYPSGDWSWRRCNADGSPAAQTVFDPNGTLHWVEYAYDGHGRLVRRDEPDGGQIEYRRDGFGREYRLVDQRQPRDNIGGAGDFTGGIAYAYDPLGRLLSRIDQDGYGVYYSWRADGRPATMTVAAPDPNIILYWVAYTHDRAGRPLTVSDMRAGLTGCIASFRHDANGNLSSLEYSLTGDPLGATVRLAYQYNRDDRLVGYGSSGGPVLTLGDVVLDGLGRLAVGRETLSDTQGGVSTQTLEYAYDRRRQLTQARRTANDGAWTQHSYAYRLDGSLARQTVQSSSAPQDITDYGYYGDLLVSATGSEQFSLTWDLNGNLTNLPNTPEQTIVAYNWADQLCSARFPDLTLENRYAPDVGLVHRQVSSGPTTTRRKYVCGEDGGLPVVLLELDPGPDPNTTDDVILRRYYWASGQVLLQEDSDPNTAAAGRYFYLHDRLGSVRLVVNAAGQVKHRYEYDPFGRTQVHQAAADAPENPWQFAGQFFDPDLGQYYLRARYYHPALPRVTARDPVQGDFEEPLSLHPYLYCRSDPVNDVDPSGEFAMGDMATAVGLGMRAYSTYSTVQSIKGYVQEFVADVELHGIFKGAAIAATSIGANVAADYLFGVALRGMAQVAGQLARFAGSQIHKHHVFPKFLGGLPKGARYGLDKGKHILFHKQLKERLVDEFGLERKAKNWSYDQWDFFLKQGNNQRRMQDLLWDFTTEFDRAHGSNMLPVLLEQFMVQLE